MKSLSMTALAVLGSLVLINLVGLTKFGRIDVTSDKMYTLSQSSKDTLSTLEDPVTITAYFTEDLPPQFAGQARYVRDLLQEYRAASKGKLSFEFIDPSKQETDEDKKTKREVKQDIFGRQFRDQTSIEKELAQNGIQPIEVRVFSEDQNQTRRVYLGIVLRYGEKKEVIPAITDVRGLEYNVTTMLRRLTRTRTPVIGILQGHEEPKLEENYRRIQGLFSQLYEVRPITLDTKDRIEDTVDGLIVLGPKTALKETELKAIDQFIMKGKSVAFFVDALQVNLKDLQQSEANPGLAPLLATYGITLSDGLVADVSSATVNMEERRGFMNLQVPVPYPFIPMVRRLENGSPVSEGLGQVTFPFTTAVTAVPPAGATALVLAKSSAKSWMEKKPFNIDARREWQSENVQFTGPYSLAVQVTGKLKSHYAAEANTSPATAGASPILAESVGESHIAVFGSATIVADSFAQQGNQMLALNLADWMVLDPALLSMRNRGMAQAQLKPEISEGTRNLTKFGNALGVPLLFVLFGLLRWRMREGRRAAVTV